MALILMNIIMKCMYPQYMQTLWTKKYNLHNEPSYFVIQNYLTNFCQHFKFLSAFEMFVNIWNFCQHLKFLSTFEIFVDIWNFANFEILFFTLLLGCQIENLLQIFTVTKFENLNYINHCNNIHNLITCLNV